MVVREGVAPMNLRPDEWQAYWDSLHAENRCTICAKQHEDYMESLICCAVPGTPHDFEHGCCWERCSDFCSSDGRGGYKRCEPEHDYGDEDVNP